VATFYLEPRQNGVGDPSWGASTLKEGLWVAARDPAHARELTEAATTKDAGVLLRGKLASPWRNLGLTTCRLEWRHFHFPAGKILTRSGRYLESPPR